MQRDTNTASALIESPLACLVHISADGYMRAAIRFRGPYESSAAVHVHCAANYCRIRNRVCVGPRNSNRRAVN